MNVTLTLDPDQIGQASIVLTDAQLASIAQQEAAQPPTTQPPTGAVPPFVPPPEVASRALMKTEVVWSKGAGSFYSPSPLTDANAWCMGFTVGDYSSGSINTIEHGGPRTLRNWALVHNADGAIVTQSKKPIQTPTIQFAQHPFPFSGQIKLTVGERYTFTVWNATAGQSSAMVGQLYL